MKFSDFFDQVSSREISVAFDYAVELPPQRLSNEAMFHLPLIALTILMMSKGQVKPVVGELGQLVGDCYERTFAGFRGSAQHLGWSASLRVRTVQALAFLEQANLVIVDLGNKRISATPNGREVIHMATSSVGDLASNLVAVERAYRNIRIEKQMRLSPA